MTGRRLTGWIASGVSLAIIATIAVIAAGFDARETPREEPSVWALRMQGQYARINTLTAEIDTVRKVEEPSGIVQSGAQVVVLSHGNGRMWNIDPSLPVDLSAEDGAGADTADATETLPAAAMPEDPTAMRAPAGTRDVLAAGDVALFRTEEGEVFLSRFGEDGAGTARLGEPQLLDPLAGEAVHAGEAADAYHADAVALDESGRVAMFSAHEHAIRWYEAEQGEFADEIGSVPETLPAEGVQLAIVAGRWAMLETESGRLWLEGSGDPVVIDAVGGLRLQASSTKEAGTDVLVADEGGLWRVSGATAERVHDFSGVPTQPVQLQGARYAAWLGADAGSLWSSEADPTPLALDTSVKQPGSPELVIRTNGTGAVVSEVQTGMLWTVPEGKMIPVEQWKLNDPPEERQGSVVVNDVTEQEPPVAVDDSFGVRAGEPAPLPVLLNDFDPNRKDVLTIVPEGLGEGVPKGFGTVSVLADGQSITVEPAPDAKGSATFRYRITDGVLTSEPATVTVSVVGERTNGEPEWCPVDGCQREWPNPEITPGGTLVLPMLEGWVDPEGDPMMLESATPVSMDDPIRALVTADGRLAVRHTDPNAPSGDIGIKVRVVDSRGEAAERELRVKVRSNAKAEMPPIAVSAKAEQTTTLRPLTRIVGGSGSFALVDAGVLTGTSAVAVNAGAGTIDITPKEPGVTTVALTARDTGTDAEITGTLRVTAVKEHVKLGLPPLRAFVRPLADTTVNVLDAVPGANSRALVVRAADVVDGELRADVIEHESIRVSGSTSDGEPGRIGSVSVTVAEGGSASTGRLTVFQVPEAGYAGAIAVADSVTVRAGAVADIPVLENDVAPPGQRLVLHPEVGGSGAKGELAFASGNTLRYLAPKTAGTYTLSYTTYSASAPEESDVGQVRVTVLPREGNRDPQPRALTVRVAPGERLTKQVPLSGADPDGDRVRLMGVAAPSDAQLTATLAPRASAIQIEASKTARPGTHALTYTVRDEFGGGAEGRLRVVVTEAGPGGGAPVAYSDYVRLAEGAKEPATVSPLDNDIDPSGGRLRLIEVVPNVAGGEESKQYRELAERLDLSQLKQGRVRIAGGELGTVSYRYTVESTESKSTADGLIVVQVSARVGLQAPTVHDTVLSARDRADLESGGIDVVTDRVFWSGGDPAALEMSVWGSAAHRFSAKGKRISGEYRPKGEMVPFKLSGTDVSGREVETFGFLVIPPLDELRLTLKPGLSPIQVDENETVAVALTDVIDLAPGDRAEFKTGSLPVQRGQARCEATSATTLRYSAGKEAPWTDTCVVSVKLTEQRVWTQLPLPISIVPDQPVAELEPMTRTVAPGATESIDLADMVEWQGGREGRTGSLRFSVVGGGQSFEVSPNGSSVSATARADAVPGAQDVLAVTVSGAGESQAQLTLRVGEAAKDSPRGASVNLNCEVGSSCQAQLIGAPGEHDPFAGKSGGGLTLRSVSGGGCAVATFQAAGGSVSVGWPKGAKGPGGKCTATFTVVDAQKRTGQGTIELDAQGVPRPPTGVTPVKADASSVTLSVALSGETSHPETTGVELVSGGRSVGSCAMAGGQATCTVTGLTPGERRTYTARAINSVGASDESVNGAETWAYRPPAPPTLQGPTTMQWADNQDPGKGRVRISVGPSSAASRMLTINGVETPINGDGVYEVAAGNVTASAISVDSASMLPPGYTGGDSGKGEASTGTGTAIGAPIAGSATLTLSGANNTDWSIATSGWSENGGDALQFAYAIGSYSGANSTGSGLTEHQRYTATVHAKNSYGVTATSTTNPATAGQKLPTITGTYTVNPVAANLSNWSITYSANAPTYSPAPTGTVDFSGVSPGSPNGTVKQCPASGVNCSDPGAVTPSGLEPLTLTLGSCVPWDGTTVPDHAEIAAHMATTLGALGGTPTYTAYADRRVTVDWGGGVRGQGTFTAALCTPTP